MSRLLFDDDVSDPGPWTPAVLVDPVPGNIPLLKYNALALLHLNEPNGVQPADAIGNLQGLATDGVLTNAPTQVASWKGLGRQFAAASSQAFITSDSPTAPAGTTLLQKEITVQAIVALTLGDTTVHTIVQRGVHDGTAGEAISFGLAYQQRAFPAGYVDVFWYWEDSAGVIHTEPEGTYVHPGDGQFFLLTATRRWETPTRVVLRYYADDRLLAERVSADGDIAGGTNGRTLIGGRKSGGVWSQFFNGVIDDLKITSYEMSAAEVRQVWRRLYVHQPAGVDMFAALAPPGAPWYRNPGNRIGKLVKIAGQALGLALAKAEEMRDTWLPDQAYSATLARWEAITGINPLPRDPLDTRRARVVSYFSRLQGFSIPAVQQALAGVFQQAAAQVSILEFTNRITDTLAAGLAPERWWTGAGGAWGAVAGVQQLTAAAGSDLRWTSSYTNSNAPFVAMTIPIRTTPASSVGTKSIIAQLELVGFNGTIPLNTIAGLFLFNFRSNDALWFGVKNVGGVLQLGWHSYNGATATLGAFNVIVNPILNQPYWINIMPPTSTFVGAFNTMQFGYSTVGPNGPFTQTNGVPDFTDYEFAGAGAMSTDAALASNLTVTFANFLLHAFNGDRPFLWYAYRDPTLAGQADIIGGELVTQKIKPAHTYSAAIASKSVLYDDPANGLHDRGPCGAL